MLRGARFLHAAAIHFDAPRGIVAGLTRGERETRHGRYRREGLAAEAHAGDAFEIVEAADLAGGMRGDGEGQFVARNTAAIVAHADQPHAALLDVHFDTTRAGIDAVFDEFLHHRRRALDDFAGRDLVDQLGRQRTDGHGGGLS